MKAFVETAGAQVREAPFRRRHHRHRDLIVGDLLHDLMMQNELVLVFQYANLDAQLNRNVSLAFADPLGECRLQL